MSRIPLVSDQDATGSVKEIFGALNKGLGLVPNMTRAMANSPAVLQAFAQFNSAMGASKLPGALREQIAVLTAESNACAYCLSAHSALGKLAGLSPARSMRRATPMRPIPRPRRRWSLPRASSTHAAA